MGTIAQFLVDARSWFRHRVCHREDWVAALNLIDAQTCRLVWESRGSPELWKPFQRGKLKITCFCQLCAHEPSVSLYTSESFITPELRKPLFRATVYNAI